MKVNNLLLMLFIASCLSTISFIKEANAQITRSDSVQYQITVKNTISFYTKNMDINSPLYNGFDNIPYGPLVKGSAYFQDSVYFDKGSVNYDGIVYYDVPLLYDVYKDILISNLLNPYLKYTLVTERIMDFSFNGHQFVRISADTANLKTGFYEEAYTNKLRVLIKREKTMQNIPGPEGLSTFDSKVSYYLKKGKQYYKVSSEGDMLSVLKDKKQQINQYINEQKIKFRQDPAKAMVLLAAYYDHLNN